MIRKRGNKWCVLSPRNPDWSGGCYRTKKEAEARLRQVERAKYARGGMGRLGGIVKAYLQKVRRMRQLERESEEAMARGDSRGAEQLMDMAYARSREARDIHERMTAPERERARSRLVHDRIPVFGRPLSRRRPR